MILPVRFVGFPKKTATVPDTTYDLLIRAAQDQTCSEVKTTMGSDTTPFFLTENSECSRRSDRKNSGFSRLYDFNHKPRAFDWFRH